MPRETSHRIISNGAPRVIPLIGHSYYYHPTNKKLLAGRVDPAKVIVTQFHYLIARDGPIKVAKDLLGINLGICTISELEGRPEWNETNYVLGSCRVKPQTLKVRTEYVGTDLLLLVPAASSIVSSAERARLLEFVAAFFYVIDHFPSATEANVRDSNMRKMWLGLFVAGFEPDGKALLELMRDHLKATDHLMVKWYPRLR